MSTSTLSKSLDHVGANNKVPDIKALMSEGMRTSGLGIIITMWQADSGSIPFQAYVYVALRSVPIWRIHSNVGEV